MKYVFNTPGHLHIQRYRHRVVIGKHIESAIAISIRITNVPVIIIDITKLVYKLSVVVIIYNKFEGHNFYTKRVDNCSKMTSFYRHFQD